MMKTGKTLIKIRIYLSVAILILITLLFLNLNKDITKNLSFLAKLQFLPAAFSFSLGVLIAWLFITLQVGRIYCSSICPLGTLQDVFSWLRYRKQKKNYHYSLPLKKLRYTILSIFGICIIMGIITIPMLLDPYSSYGRIVNTFLLPIRNAIGDKSFLQLGSFSLLGTVIGVISFVVIAGISYYKGRLWCNSLCPVGTTLGMVSKYSIWQMEIDTDKCVGCLECERVCKSSCIDLNSHVIDTSRCVMCLNCYDACRHDALHFTASRKRLSTPLLETINKVPEPAQSANFDRRKFLLVTGVLTTALATTKAMKYIDSANAEIAGLKSIQSTCAVTPPGTLSRSHFHHHCTSCMLCVNNCPTQVLKPSITEYGVCNLLQPTMAYDSSYCLKECTQCTQICPTGALHPISLADKLASPIGIAQVIEQNCIHCGKCASACPCNAITMTSNYTPTVNSTKCIGCGSCQHACLATPIKAIYVTGI